MTAPTTDEQYLSDKSVATRYQTSRATIWRWARNGKIPQPFKIGEGVTRWRLSELVEWERTRSAA